METYVIAATEGDLFRGMGTEIMASGPNEAVSKYEAIGGCATEHGGIVMRHPDGSISPEWVEVKQCFDDSLPPMAFTD